MYSRIEVCDGRLEQSVFVCRNSGGRIDVLTNGNTATGSALGRMLNVAGSWSAGDAEGRRDGTLGSDGGRQSEEEYGSGEGLGEHLSNEWMEVCRMEAGSARDRLCRTSLLRMRGWSGG
jgi:hypothetical protein